MAKLGKYSTGFSEPKKAGNPYGMSNKGAAAATNMMSEFKTMEPRQRPAPGYVGAAKDPELKRGK
jgi:hypothetical protein